MIQQKFLVTGATGDTGGYTVEQLLERCRRAEQFPSELRKEKLNLTTYRLVCID